MRAQVLRQQPLWGSWLVYLKDQDVSLNFQ